MVLILDLLSLGFYLPFLKPDESDIARNIGKLKKLSWYNSLVNDPKARELIIHDSKVRQVIGRFKTDKLELTTYQRICQRRLETILARKTAI